MSKIGFIKKFFRFIKKNETLRYLFAYTLYLLVRCLFLTYRLKFTCDDFYKNKELQKQHGVFYFWHQHIISGMFFFFKTNSKGYCIASPSSDGKIAGFICEKLGFNVLYGSSTKSLISLIKNSMSVLQERRQLCVVGDGSRGPAFKLQKGVSYLAKKNDLPLVFVECRVNRAITFKKSWDKFKIPLPFTTIHVRLHKPIFPEKP